MNKFEQFLSANKAILVILTIIVLPFVLAFCLIYGVIVGFLGITVDRWEYVRGILRQDALMMLKYPKWSAKKHFEAYLNTIDNPDERKRADWAIKAGLKKAPGLTAEMITDIIIFGVLDYPLFLVWGIITGPVRALLEFWKWWMKVWGKEVWGVSYY